jgi:dTMP kinase
MDDGRRPGRFLTLEGPEGAGKSTQARRIHDHLAGRGVDVVLTREPGGTRVGEAIREVLLSTDTGAQPASPRVDALLFSAARAQLVDEVIRPALERGAVVVCDRYTDSTLAYQGHAGGLSMDALRALATFATGGLEPDLTILLDLPVEDGLARKTGSETRFEQAFGVDYHRRVREGFLALAGAEPDRWVVIDAARSADLVAGDVLAAVERRPLPSGTAR